MRTFDAYINKVSKKEKKFQSSTGMLSFFTPHLEKKI
jgi:hypothetical protein